MRGESIVSRSIPPSHLDLFVKKAFAHLATLMPDGSPQVSPVWVDYDGTHVLVNSSRGRQKDRNMTARPKVALNIQDPDSPYRYLLVRGAVVEHTSEGAVDHIHKLSMRYRGKMYGSLKPGEVRVIYRIRPEHVTARG
jgi:PPOX class probable F420-dependent enzyme